jgi:hypothetical protein
MAHPVENPVRNQPTRSPFPDRHPPLHPPEWDHPGNVGVSELAEDDDKCAPPADGTN